VAAILVLGVSAIPIKRHSVSAFETRIFHTINGLPAFLYWPVWLDMQLGNVLAVPVVTVIALLARRFRMALDLAISGTAAYLLAKIIKGLIVRGRPRALLDHVILRHSFDTGHGYISGHSAVAFALATSASAYLPRWAQCVVWIAAAGVAFARVYVGAHLPLDVVGGAALGWGVGSLVHLALGAPDRSGGPDRSKNPRDAVVA
jgi:membrane-associated phospholipid phosphatase